MNERLSQLSASQREQHFHLTPQHRCYYWGEYTPWAFTFGKNAEFSETNGLIANLKLSLDLRDTQDWERKLHAIDTIGRAFSRFWRWSELAEKCMLVPIPASRRRDDPLYDSRMELILESIQEHAGRSLNCVNLLESDGSLEASHIAEKRPKIAALEQSLSINSGLLPTVSPQLIYLFDDVLTTGAHFSACSKHIQTVYPESKIVGNFVARSKRPDVCERS
jgi:hypothetical protein